jgi:hypothetical protein
LVLHSLVVNNQAIYGDWYCTHLWYNNQAVYGIGIAFTGGTIIKLYMGLVLHSLVVQ